MFPSDYRNWAYVTTGLGMSYSPNAMDADNPIFDNVFVPRSSFKYFQETGHWPDRTMFVIEQRRSQSKGSINQAGHFQTDLAGFDVEVKDPGTSDTWRYYGFGADAAAKHLTAHAVPHDAGCYECHSKNGAVEHTFVQFYPALLDVAKAKGTLNPSYSQQH